MINTYQLSPLFGSAIHANRKFWLLNDFDEPLERERLKTHIRSGDYFGLLATDLDEISQLISDTNVSQSISLQQIIENLLYVERNYRLVPK